MSTDMSVQMLEELLDEMTGIQEKAMDALEQAVENDGESFTSIAQATINTCNIGIQTSILSFRLQRILEAIEDQTNAIENLSKRLGMFDANTGVMH